MHVCTFGRRSLPLFFNTVSSDTLPCPIYVFPFAHQRDQELCSKLALLTVSFTSGCNGHTLDITGLQYYRLSLVSRYNCCIVGTFCTPQQTPPTIYHTPPRFILKDPGLQLNWEILQKPVIIRIPRVTPGLVKVQETDQ
jgi:hypothetical protein